MKISRYLAVILLVAGTAGVCAAAPAAADSGVPTSLALYQDKQTPYSYTNESITLTGTLVDSSSSVLTGIANEPVTITEEVAGAGPAKDVASVTTDSSGNFSVTLTDQPVSGIFQAVFAGDTSNGNDYDASTSSAVNVTSDPSVVAGTWTYPTGPVAVGSTVTISGKVYVGTEPEPPIAGATVWAFTGNPGTLTSPHAVTGADGSFSMSFRVTATAKYQLTVVSGEPPAYSPYENETVLGQTELTVMNSEKPDYMLADTAGTVDSFNASGSGPLPYTVPAASVVGIAADPSTNGYWAVTSKGNVYNFNATWHGSAAGRSLPAPITGIAADSKTGGYWLVSRAGNVYNYDAPWYGSEAGKSLPSPVVGIAAVGNGYALVTAKGNVYNFNTPFHGSEAGKSLPSPVVGIAGVGSGYDLDTAKGNVYNFNATWHGSAAGRSLPAPITGIAADSKTGGYWLVSRAGNVYNYDAPWYGSEASENASSGNAEQFSGISASS